jgi:hypothetical protein
MKKTFFVLITGLLCISSSSASSAHQSISAIDSKTVKQLDAPPLTSSDQIVLLAPTDPPTKSTGASPAPPCSSDEKAPSLAGGELEGVQAKKGHPLKGCTSGDKSIDTFIIASAERNNLDPVLLYSVMHQESAFNPRAVSRKGACGLMQVIPATATRFGVRNIFNPQQNIEAGARYLRFLLDTFEGDVSLALAAYNAGEGNVKKYMGQVPPFEETIKYVSEIKQRYEAINNLPLQTAARGADESRRSG